MWVGPEYDESYFIACILMIPVTIPLIQNIGINILQAKNMYKFRVIILLFFAVINVIVSIILSKIYGGIGAAIGTAISLVGGAIISMNIFYHKKVGINIIEFWKNIAKMTLPVIISIILGIILKALIPISNNIILVIQIFIYTIMYIIFMWRLGMNNYEKELLIKPIKTVLKGTR